MWMTSIGAEENVHNVARRFNPCWLEEFMCRRSSCRKSTGLIQQRSHVAICDWNMIAGTGFSITTDPNCKVGELQQYQLSLLHFDRLCVGCHNLGPWYQRSWFVRKTPKNIYVNVSDQSSIFINQTKILILICWKCFWAFNVLNMTRTDGWLQNFSKKETL